MSAKKHTDISALTRDYQACSTHHQKAIDRIAELQTEIKAKQDQLKQCKKALPKEKKAAFVAKQRLAKALNKLRR